MAYEIKIKEGHDPSSYFWFRPVIVKKKEKILWSDVQELDDEFSIEENDIYCFLSYFFLKYFDRNLYFNQHRFEYAGYIEGFEWNLTTNFYTYDCINKMLDDIESAAEMLKNDYSNELLAPVKEKFSLYNMCEPSHSDWINRNQAAIKDHVDVVIDFYGRFVHRLRKMMSDNPQTHLISIMGP